ncbi:MAG TPA: hypothetical protein PKH36_12610 [Flavobacteriales bacterium]|nr:hypothetical protein [Flavobacteriales bacterium]MCC6654752.1 hypothetical protein [Flavobacteriales bacterium]HMZ49490.1 hypothetical protein [Flavobacteriales bacterium]HNK69559.1 hypothetical protein [Flavobacteriales bacterium]
MTHSTLRKRPVRRSASPMPILQGPRPSTIHAILSYSKALRVVDAPPVGQVNIVLN